MKKIFLLILIVISINGISQTGFPGTQSMANANTKLVVNGGLEAVRGLINGVFTDTSAANADKIDFYNGAQIWTRSDRNFWLRDSVLNMWVRMAKFSDVGGGTPTLQQVLTAGSSLTGDNTIDGNNNSLFFDDFGIIQAKIRTGSGNSLLLDDLVSRIISPDQNAYVSAENGTYVDLKYSSNHIRVRADSTTSIKKIVYQTNINGDLTTPNSLVTRSLVDSLIGAGGGGGTNNANVGSGFRWLKPGPQEIKTVRGESGILIDSSSHTDELTIKADTTNANAGSLVTNGDFYRRLDSLNQRFIQLDQKTRYDQFLDIASSDFGAFAWSVGGSGAFIQGVSWVASPAIPVGWMLAQKMSTGTTSAGIAFHWTVVGGDYAAISMSSSYRYNFGVNMRLEDLSDGTNTFTYVTGFHDNNNNPGGIVDGVYFRYIHSDSSGKWIACTRNNSSVTEVATNVTVAADTDYKLEISVIGGSAFFYINDVLKATISTNIPDDDNARTVSVINLFQKTVGTAERFAWVEWLAYGKRYN